MSPGEAIDTKYLIVRQLGQGGMGAVYEARHAGTGRRVAVKVIVGETLQKNRDVPSARLVPGDADTVEEAHPQDEATALGAQRARAREQVHAAGLLLVESRAPTEYIIECWLQPIQGDPGEQSNRVCARAGGSWAAEPPVVAFLR